MTSTEIEMNFNRVTIAPRRLWSLLLAAAVAVISIGAWTFWQYSHSRASSQVDADADAEPAIKPVSITSAAVTSRAIERTVDSVGTLEAYEAISIRAKVEGQVRRLLCDVADRVEPLSALLEIDATDYELAVRQADRTLQVELSRIGLDKVPEVQFDITQLPSVKQAYTKMAYNNANSLRLQTLAAAKAISVQDLDSAQTEFRWSEAEYENQMLIAKANLATVWMKAESLAIARQRQTDTMVLAPNPQRRVPHQIDARVYAVSARSVSEGTYVRTGDELIRLVIDATLRLKTPIPERYLGVVRLGQLAHVAIAARPTGISGIVTRVNPVIDPTTRSFEVEIEISNAEGNLKAGGFAKASIVVDENGSATIVPLESIVSFAGITKVFIVDDDHVREVQVKLGMQGTEWVEILDPKLDLQSQVITSGQTALADGSRIIFRQSPNANP